MTTVFDPGALLAARTTTADRSSVPLPRAPMVPSPLPGAAGLRTLGHLTARGLTALAAATTGYERRPKPSPGGPCDH